MSPIRKENYRLYPGGSPESKEWKAIREEVLQRQRHRCMFCGVPDREWIERDAANPALWKRCTEDPTVHTMDRSPVKIILTVAHLDHNPSNNDDANLAALCQLCHNRYDAAQRKANRKANRLAAMKEQADE